MEEKKIRSTRKMPVDGKMQCTKCKEWKELDCYSPNAKRPCGVSCHCKPCQAEYSKDYYRRNPRKCIERAKDWDVKNPEKRNQILKNHYHLTKEYMRRSYRVNNHKWRARAEVFRALRAGKIQRGGCEVCGAGNSEAHHWSYDQAHWLDVKWLCRTHHQEEHKKLREESKVDINKLDSRVVQNS